jgi:hypothetical protein
MTPTLTLTQVKRLQPCRHSLKRIARFLGDVPLTASEARAAGAKLDDVAWAAAAVASIDKDVRRRRCLWMADCAVRMLPLFEREQPTDQRPRRAIEAARAYARAEIGEAALSAAGADGYDGWDAAARDAARYAALAAARTAAARDAAWATGDWSAAWAAADWWAAAEWDSASNAEAAWQFDRLVERLSDPEPEDWPLPPMAL